MYRLAIGAVVMEQRDMVSAEDIPVEIRARVEATALFDALREGDYASAAEAQEHLRSLGWYVSREPRRKRRATPENGRGSKGGVS
jgi:hypothetical protein